MHKGLQLTISPFPHNNKTIEQSINPDSMNIHKSIQYEKNPFS